MIALLDTHTVIWALDDDPKLGGEARKIISHALSGSLGISDISLFEISMLVSKDRIRIQRGSLESYLQTINRLLKVIPIDPAIATLSMSLPLPQSDPFDRIITATASTLKLPLLTRDRKIVESRLVETVWD